MKSLSVLLVVLALLSGCADMFYQPERIKKWPDLGLRIAVVVVHDSVEPGEEKRHFLIRAVRPDTPAQSAGVRPGDILQALDGKTIHHISDALEIMRSKRNKDNVVLTITRGEETLVLTVDLATAVLHSSI